MTIQMKAIDRAPAIEQLSQPWFICFQKDTYFFHLTLFFLFILQCPSGNEDQEITATNVRVWRR